GFPKISIGKIELHVIGIGVRAQRSLKVANGVVVQAIARKKHADSRLHAKILRAHLVKLRNAVASLLRFPELQLRFSKKIKILRPVWMLLNLFSQFRQIKLRAFSRCKIRAIVEIMEEVLIWIRAGRG